MRNIVCIGLLLAACSRGSNSEDVVAVDADVKNDAFVPLPDAAPQTAAMYVHSGNTLYSIEDDSFELEEIGMFGTTDAVTDLAVTSNGTIYVITNTDLYTVDSKNAQATWVAEVLGDNVGLTFLDDGRLLATDQTGGVRTINPTTGFVQEVGTFGGGYATAGDLVAVANGTMYAISDEGPNGDEDVNNVLLTVNTTTGAYIEAIGQIGFGKVWGVAVANNKIYGFTSKADVIEIDPVTAAGTLVRSFPGNTFWGAGVSPTADIDID